MATKQETKTPESAPKMALYASLGAGQLAVEKAKALSGKVVEMAQRPADERMKNAVKVYEGLATRGEKLVSGLRKSGYPQAVADQAHTATRQVKTATGKGVSATTKTGKKAVDTTAKAAKAAAGSIG
jgi:hypothetical protein